MKPTKCEEQGRAAGNRPPTQSAATWMPTFTSLHAAFQKGFLRAPTHMFALQNYSETTPDHALSLCWQNPPSLPNCSSACPPRLQTDPKCLLDLSLVLEHVALLHPLLHPSICNGGFLSLSPQNIGLCHCELFKPLGWEPF